jgi:hypothetical protein
MGSRARGAAGLVAFACLTLFPSIAAAQLTGAAILEPETHDSRLTTVRDITSAQHRVRRLRRDRDRLRAGRAEDWHGGHLESRVGGGWTGPLHPGGLG